MSGQQSLGVSAQAHIIISAAFDKFKGTVTPEDIQLFNSTSVDDVIRALRAIQGDLRAKRENRNLAKLVPFLEGLKKYGQAIDVLSNGLSPFLPWAWAPVRLFLQITSDHLGAFDKLLDAYARIADTLPRINTIGESFSDKPAMLTKLTLYYADLIEFHRRAYKFVRRRSWKSFFMTTWGQFDLRFDSILTSLAYHSDLITQEAQSIDLVEARRWRDELMSKTKRDEEERAQRQKATLVSWLAVTPISQEEERERLLRDFVPGTCDWLRQKLPVWFQTTSPRQPAVWLHGKPGSGKSVLCANLIDMSKSASLTTLFYFCRHGELSTASDVLKTLLLQVITLSKDDLVPIAFAEFVLNHNTPTRQVLRDMLVGSGDKEGFLHSLSPCRLIVDGIDECEKEEQKFIVEDLVQLTSSRSLSYTCQLLLCSQHVPTISTTLRRKVKGLVEVSLSSEHAFLNASIRAFVTKRLDDIRHNLVVFSTDAELIESIHHEIVDRAGGMFLWTKLVLDALSDVDSMRELHDAIIEMPPGLYELYSKLLRRISITVGEVQMNKVYRFLAWMVFAKRPLRRHEILHGAAITYDNPVLNQWNALQPAAIDKCRPLIEMSHSGTIGLAHFTVEEYLRESHDLQRFVTSEQQQLIAFVCISVLRNGLTLVDPSTPLNDRLTQLANGSHSLLSYALDFWTQHLEDAVPSQRLATSSTLFTALAALDYEHNRLCQHLHRPLLDVRGFDECGSCSLIEVPIYAASSSFRETTTAKAAPGMEESQDAATAPDPTLFSALSAKVVGLVQEVASGYTDSGLLSQEQLSSLRDNHGFHLYRCRHPPCVYTSLGFVTEMARIEHERLHAQGLFCDQPGCHRGRIGFKNAKDLRRHVKANHQEGGILVPPRVRPTKPAQIANDVNQDTVTTKHSVQRQLVPTPQTKRISIPVAWDVDKVQKDTNERLSIPNDDGRLDAFTDWMCLYDQYRPRKVHINLLQTIDWLPVVTFVQLSHSGSLLAVCAHGATHVYYADSGMQLVALVHDSPVKGLYHKDISASFCPTDKLLAIAHDDGEISIRDVATGAMIKIFRHGSSHLDHAVFSHDGRLVASTGNDETVKVWDMADDSSSEQRYLLKAPERIVSLAFSKDDRSLILACVNHQVLVWNIGSTTTVLKGGGGSVHDIDFTADGKTIISASLDSTVRLWSAEDLSCQQILEGHEGLTLSVNAVKDTERWGDFIISVSKDKSFRVWNYKTGECEVVVKGHRNTVMSVDTSVLGGVLRIASASGRKTVRIWSCSMLQ